MIDLLHCGHSSFDFRKQALLISANCLDFTYETSALKFEITGTEPPGTSRRIIFKIDDKLYRFVNNILDEYPYRGELQDILQFGNTVAELLALDNIPAFVDKMVYPIIALDAPADAPVMPKIHIAVKVSSYNDVYTKFVHSPIFELEPHAMIVAIQEDKTITGHATALTQCRINKLSGWSDWMTLAEAQYQVASQIQFRTNYVLTTLDGTDSITINHISVRYTSDFECVASNFRTFISKTTEYQADLKTCYLLVNHEPLIDVDIEAFVNLTPATRRRENFFLGKTSGYNQTLYLPDKYLAQDTLHIELDGTPFFDFDYDTERAALTFTAPPNCDVTASYDFAPAENWLPMTKDIAELNRTRFTFNTDAENLRDAAVMFTLKARRAHVETTATGNGAEQLFALEHYAQAVACNVPHSFDVQSQILRTLAPIDSTIIFSYDWLATLPNVHSYIAGFAV